MVPFFWLYSALDPVVVSTNPILSGTSLNECYHDAFIREFQFNHNQCLFFFFFFFFFLFFFFFFFLLEHVACATIFC
jgi:hypothetical protein